MRPIERQRDETSEIDDVLAWHDGDPRAAIATLVADCAYLRWQLEGGAPYAFAGLWAHNTQMETPVTSCTIITGPAVAPISQIHDSMPIIRDPSVFDAWLSPATPVEELIGILAHYLDAQMQMHRVSREVNKATFQGRPEPIVNSL